MRLWTVSVVVELGSLLALGHGLAGHSLWPAVGLFAVAGAIACVAAGIDVDASRTEKASLVSVRASVDALKAERDTMMAVINAHAEDIDRLKRKDALSQVG